MALPNWPARALAMGCLVLPWVNPAAWGPSASVIPWLASAACAVVLWVLFSWKVPAGTLLAAWGPLIAAAWLAAALISSVIALCQYFDLAHHFVPLMSVGPPGEAFANLRQRNQFASLSVIGMASLLWWTSRGLAGGYAWSAMALLAVANAASASRTGLLQVLVLTVLAAGWPGLDRGKRVGLCAMGVVAYLLASLALPQLLEAFTGLTAPNVWGRLASGQDCNSRVVLWSNVLHLIAQKPWLGWGWGELDYAHYMTLYEGARFCDILDNAHNLPLHLAVELGLPAAAAICGGFLWWVVRAKPWLEPDPIRQLAWSVLAVILLHNMLEYPLWYGPFQLALVLSLVLLSRHSHATAADFAGRVLWSPGIRRALALALMGAISFAAWDYYRVSQAYLPPEARTPALRQDPLSGARESRLFRDQARFAELTITPLSQGNAQWTFDTANQLLHYSPEPRVIEKLIESGIVLGRQDEALLHLARFRAAFPQDYEKWTRSRSQAAQPPT
jgi:O-antigen ligase